jgi:dipeptide/tripeptide permease
VHGKGGTVVAAFQMSADLGAVIGPLAAGKLADTYSFGAAFGVTAAVIAAGLLTAALSTETKHRPEVEDPQPTPGTSG